MNMGKNVYNMPPCNYRCNTFNYKGLLANHSSQKHASIANFSVTVHVRRQFLLGTVVFCTSVRHAEEMAALFQAHGIDVHSVSGSTRPVERKRILERYEQGSIPVLCACDLLNEGWDSPHTQVLFMARPTMSKTIYMQQLGRGMRKAPGKDFLMVFDFVDNANMFNTPYSMHRLLGINQYRAGGLVLGNKAAIKWDQNMFAQGEKPEVLIDYPIHITDMEHIDLFNWQEQAKNMVSQIEFTRRVSVQNETIERYTRDGKLVPDLEVPISEHRSFKYFYPETIERYAKEYKWKLITPANMWFALLIQPKSPHRSRLTRLFFACNPSTLSNPLYFPRIHSDEG